MPGRYVKGRTPAGRYHPSKALRLKVHHRCGECGWDLFQGELRPMRSTRSPCRGDNMHLRRGNPKGKNRFCGPVFTAPNPRYRQA